MWSADGDHPPLDLCIHEPITASALQAHRQHLEDRAAGEGDAPPRVAEIDVWPVVARSGIRNTADEPFAKEKLMKYAKKHCSKAMVTFLFKNRARLNSLIDDIWEWETVDDRLLHLRQTRIDMMSQAWALPCRCGGTGWRAGLLPEEQCTGW